MTTATSNDPELAQIKLELARLSFVRFLDFVKIESDDPEHPGVVKWQPWPYLVERAAAWESGVSEVLLKTRQHGASWLAGAYAYWKACYHETAHVGMFSKGEVEAKKLLRKVKYIHQHLPPGLRDPNAKFGALLAEFSSGSEIRAFPSTMDAGLGDTYQLVIADEAAFHPYASENYGAVVPTLSAGGQYLCMSTASPELGPAGFFYDMYFNSKRGQTGYSVVFWPWHTRPGNDAAWYEEEKAKYVGMPEKFDAYYPETDAQAFVARSGLVFPGWDDAKYARPDPCKWEEYRIRVAGVDFGGGDPTAVIPLGMTGSGRLHQPEEFYKRGPVTITEIGEYLLKLHTKARFYSIECDPSEPVAIATLRAAGLPAVPADNRRDGILIVNSIIEQGRLTINPNCKESLAEFPNYRWRERVDPHSHERYATSTPVMNHADAHDGRRYGMIRIVRGENTGPAIASYSGKIRRRRRRKAV